MTVPRRQAVAERRATLLGLRRKGLTYQQIVDDHPDLGYRTASAASKDAQRALSKIVTESAEDLRDLELSRIDAIWAAIYDRGVGGDLWAVDRLVRLSAHRVRLLGLEQVIAEAAERAGREASTERARAAVRTTRFSVVTNHEEWLAARAGELTPPTFTLGDLSSA